MKILFHSDSKIQRLNLGKHLEKYVYGNSDISWCCDSGFHVKRIKVEIDNKSFTSVEIPVKLN